MRINTVTLRILIGMLSIALPWIVALLYGGFPASISATYYVAECITPFMGILSSASMLLVSYKGYDKTDDIILTIAGICGALICLFPCANPDMILVGTFRLPQAVSGIIHNIAALTFFGLLAYNSLFLFTKSSGEMTAKKKARNVIYRVCGIGIIASFALALLPVFSHIWIMETALLSFFGVSFLTKADVFPFLFCDTSYKTGIDD